MGNARGGSDGRFSVQAFPLCLSMVSMAEASRGSRVRKGAFRIAAAAFFLSSGRNASSPLLGLLTVSLARGPSFAGRSELGDAGGEGRKVREDARFGDKLPGTV